MKILNLRTRKFNGVQKIDLNKKRPMDYTEIAYRKAVSKLKYLLAESYISKPITRKSPGFKNHQIESVKINDSKEDTEVDDTSVIVDNSKTKDLHENLNRFINPQFASCKSIHQLKTYSNLTFSTGDLQSVPPELNSFIEQQEEYIHQLEQESLFCRNQLNNLLHKVREVVAENDTLYYRKKSGFLKYVLDEYTQVEDINDNFKLKSIQADIPETKKQKTLEGSNIVLESRISELEAQLTQTKLELRKVQDENKLNLKRLSECSLNNDISELKVQLERVLHAKSKAETKLGSLEKSLTLIQNKEAEAVQRAKQSADAMQQIEFEKNHYEAEMKRLKEELDKQHEKLREATQEVSRRIMEERQEVECRYNQQVEQLSADIASHWDATNKSQLEFEKQRRELTELKKELFEKQTCIDNLKKEFQTKMSTLQVEMNEALSKKDAAEQEVRNMKLDVERSERQNRQEQSRLQIELNSCKQRLERADADLAYCRKENLRLSEQIASLEKEVSKNKLCSEDSSTKLENEKRLPSMTMNANSKHERVTERDVTTVGKTASNKKRTLKVDLNVKIIPKQK